jgi:PAS domain S-box-containing protein
MVEIQDTGANVSEQINSEVASSEAQTLALSALELNPNVIYVFDSATGATLYINEAGAQRLGLQATEVIALGEAFVEQRMHPEDQTRFKAHISRLAAANTGTVAQIEYRMRDRHGKWRWFESSDAVVRGSIGRPNHLIGTATDVTERREAQTQLQISETRFRAVQQTTPDGFMIFQSVRDENNQITDFTWLYCNPAAERIVGRTAEELIGRQLLIEMPGNRSEGLFDGYVEVVTTGQIWQREFKYTHEGINRTFRSTAAPAGDGFAVSFTDITEQQLALDALKKSESRLRQLSEAQQRFVTDVSHELRAPLTSIMGNLQLLNRHTNIPPDEQREMLTEALSEASRMQRLIADLLALARGENEISMRRQPIALHELLLDTWTQGQGLSETHQFSIVSLEPAWVSGDRDHLRQLLLILIENAVRYTPSEGAITLELRLEGRCAVVCVRDTGIGIAPEEAERVFERFYRSPNGRIRSADGTGLGLAIARAIALAHGGSVRLEGELGVGTSAMVTLPLLPETQALS